MPFERFRPGCRRFCGAAFVLAVLLAAPDQGFAEEDHPKLLLLPILVHSAEDPQYLKDGLADMLSARFSRIGALKLVDTREPPEGTTSLAKAIEIGRKAGADFVLYGSFTRFGKGASLDVQCVSTDKDKEHELLREIFVHSGSIGEIIADLDELAGKVSRFASGDVMPTSTVAALSSGPTPDASAAGSVQELVDRIEALEAALTQILEDEPDLEPDLDEPAEELR